jgi:hypothetical protein
MKMSQRVEKAYMELEGVVAEMSVKEAEGINYKKPLKFLRDTLPDVLRLKRSLRERGQ